MTGRPLETDLDREAQPATNAHNRLAERFLCISNHLQISQPLQDTAVTIVQSGLENDIRYASDARNSVKDEDRRKGLI